MNKKKLLGLLIATVLSIVFISGCAILKKTDESANEVFKNYYAAVTGTMSASVHRDDFHWRNGSEPFPYLEEAKWTDMKIFIRSCSGEDIALMHGVLDTLNLNMGYEDSREATDRVTAYWESQGWEVIDITSEKEHDKRQIITVTDTDINLLYTASSHGEAIEATSKCIPEFYHRDSPVEEPVVYPAQK